MTKSYNLVINSQQFLTRDNANTASRVTYNVDWGFLPKDKSFKCSFSFQSRDGQFDATSLTQLVVDFGGYLTTYTGASANGFASSNTIGTLQPRSVSDTAGGIDNIMQCDWLNNPPFYMSSRPATNQFTVSILNNDGTLFAPAGGMPNYIIILHFEEA